jgi:preprotein translocase subunit YajC
MDNIINWGLLRHPMNWLTLILMVMIAAAAFHFVMLHYNQTKQTAT